MEINIYMAQILKRLCNPEVKEFGTTRARPNRIILNQSKIEQLLIIDLYDDLLNFVLAHHIITK